VGSGTQAQQTAKLLVALEQHFTAARPDLVVVFGDINSTLAAALVASKMLISVAHVEAGLRSFDRTMPEEINRILTDAISDLLFTTEASANLNLLREGATPAKIHFVGNLMIDTLLKHRGAAAALGVPAYYGLQPKSYAVVTLHRPSNVDDEVTFERIFTRLAHLAREYPIVFPVHPRTRARITEPQLAAAGTQLHLVEPMGYLEFLGLMQDARVLLTDSGGIQEEAMILSIPCITLRHNTERPVTLAGDANILVGDDVDRMTALTRAAFSGEWVVPQAPPEKWDGHAAQRLAGAIESWFASRSN
jgi:UDP-N-acetylglucosamine 2-epimerase (non-hydrolysing)